MDRRQQPRGRARPLRSREVPAKINPAHQADESPPQGGMEPETEVTSMYSADLFAYMFWQEGCNGNEEKGNASDNSSSSPHDHDNRSGSSKGRCSPADRRGSPRGAAPNVTGNSDREYGLPDYLVSRTGPELDKKGPTDVSIKTSSNYSVSNSSTDTDQDDSTSTPSLLIRKSMKTAELKD
ncbi:unnamed protein product [Orchesella dallaii]|uniref:Uncharacterized protein n=1 Tax=Orchesella dallaii TaxID=48710 RepID=A0ABP1QPX9_9HEXA